MDHGHGFVFMYRGLRVHRLSSISLRICVRPLFHGRADRCAPGLDRLRSGPRPGP